MEEDRPFPINSAFMIMIMIIIIIIVEKPHFVLQNT